MDHPEPPAGGDRNIGARVMRGGAWIYGRMLLTNLINLGVMAILARRLTPAEFGLAALAQVVLRVLILLGEDGVGSYVIYDNREGREQRVHAAFWMDLSLSIGAACIGLLLARPIARFYAEPALAAILAAFLLRYPLDTLSQVPDALLKKRLQFNKLVIRDTILEILTSLAMILLALTGWGVWSLVLPGLAAAPLRAAAAFWLSRWRPAFDLNLRLWPRVFSFSANSIGSSLTNFIINEGDTLLIGKLLGSHALGIYNLAWTAANMVGRNLTGLASQLTLPGFSAVAADPSRLRAGVFRVLRVISIVVFPLLVGMFVVADDFVLTVYGEQWTGAILPLRILIVFALRHAAASPAGPLYVAVGRPDFGFKIGLLTVPIYLASIWIGSRYGVVGVAAGVTIARVLAGVVSFKLVAWCLKVRFLQVLQPLAPAFLAACTMGAVVWLSKALLPSIMAVNAPLRLATLVVIGGLTYLVLLRSVFRSSARVLGSVSAPVLGPLQGVMTKVLNIQ